MPYKKISAVMFDLGDTLFEPLDALYIERNLYDIALGASVEINARQLLSSFRDTRNRIERELSQSKSTFYLHRDFVREVLSSMFESFGCSLSNELLEQFCLAQRDAVVENLCPRKDCTETLKQLRQCGYKLAIVSNIDDEWIEPIREKWALDHMVDGILSSERARSCKPDSSIFLQACRMIGVRPQETLFVGDSIDNDVRGSQIVGMHPIWFKTARTDLRQPDLVRTVSKLSDLVEILNPEENG